MVNISLNDRVLPPSLLQGNIFGTGHFGNFHPVSNLFPFREDSDCAAASRVADYLDLFHPEA